jgi:hypothetical protein
MRLESFRVHRLFWPQIEKRGRKWNLGIRIIDDSCYGGRLHLGLKTNL